MLMQQLRELADRIMELEPKRAKFSFKNRPAKQHKEKRNVVETALPIVAPVATGHVISDQTRCTISVPRNLSTTDFKLQNMSDVIIDFTSVPITSIFVSNLVRCVVIGCVVGGSVFLEGCRRSAIQVKCQQLRMHHSTELYIRCELASTGIIEDSHDLHFISDADSVILFLY